MDKDVNSTHPEVRAANSPASKPNDTDALRGSPGREPQCPVAAVPPSALDRDVDLLTYVVGLLDEMKQQGVVEGGYYRLGESGKRRFAELRSQGYSTTEDEVRRAMDLLQRSQPEAGAEG